MMQKTMTKRPWCPFCGQVVEAAAALPDRKMTEFPIGRCNCGAVYSCDATGHNIGAALVETLVYACGDKSDLAWELLPEEDYLTGRIENYDELTHQVVDTGTLDGRSIRGVLYFVRLHRDISDVAERLRIKQNEDAQAVAVARGFVPPAVEPAPAAGRSRRRADKKLVKELMTAGNEDDLVALCLEDRKTLRLMQRLLYDPDETARWRMSWLIGGVCARVATRDPGQVSELLHRAFEACADSAATPWGMVETIGSVVAMRPDIFGAFAQYIFGFVGHEAIRVQAIWALAEIAESRPDLIRKAPFYALFPLLGDARADVRGQTARLLGRVSAAEASMQLMALHDDKAELVIWQKGMPLQTTVAEQAAAAVRMIQTMKKGA